MTSAKTPEAKKKSQRRGNLHDASEQPLIAGSLAVFVDHQSCAAPLSSQSDALHQPEKYKSAGSEHPGRFKARQAADQKSRRAHQHQNDNQNASASDSISIVTENQSPQRARYESNAVDGKRQKQRQALVQTGKENRRENNGGSGSVDEMVVKLQHRPE